MAPPIRPGPYGSYPLGPLSGLSYSASDPAGLPEGPPIELVTGGR